MSLPMILDIIYLAIFLICLLVGIFKGWTKTLLGFALVFVAGLLANVFMPTFLPMVKDFVVPGQSESLHAMVSGKSLEFIDESFSFLTSPIDAKLATEHNIKAIVCGSFYIPTSFWPQIWALVQPNLAGATTGSEVRLDIALASTAGDGACQIITWLLVYLVVYIVGTLIINIVFWIINGIRKAKSPDHKIHRPLWSRLLGCVFGLLIGATLIVGFNTTAHMFTSIDPEGKIFPLEAALNIENGEMTTPSFSGWVYLVTGKISDTFFPNNSEEANKEENLDHLVITLDKDDPNVTIPAMGGAINSTDIPEGMEEYITVGEDGSLTVEFPTTEEGYNDLVSNVASASGVTEDEVKAYLEAAGVDVEVDEDGSVTYNINVPTDPEDINEWIQNLTDIHSGESGESGEGEGGGE